MPPLSSNDTMTSVNDSSDSGGGSGGVLSRHKMATPPQRDGRAHQTKTQPHQRIDAITDDQSYDDERESLIRRGESSSSSKKKTMMYVDLHGDNGDTNNCYGYRGDSSNSSNTYIMRTTPSKSKTVSFHNNNNSSSNSNNNINNNGPGVGMQMQNHDDIRIRRNGSSAGSNTRSCSKSGGSFGSLLSMSKAPFLRRCMSSIRQTISAPITGWRMLRLWLFGMIAPLGFATWTLTNQFSAVVLSVLVLPTIAILQGSIAIIKYRVKYGDSPLPLAPSHGIVKCISKSSTSSSSSTTTTATENIDSTPEPSNPLLEFDDIVTKTGSVVVNSNMDNGADMSDSNSTPLRLLVIGDSLAVGVGQSKCSTPIMPETIAKSLSKAMNGRPVLWTCHGAPGASAGWIVRELERSIHHGQFVQQQTYYPLSPTKKLMPRNSEIHGEQQQEHHSDGTRNMNSMDDDDNKKISKHEGVASSSSSSRSFDSASSSSSFESFDENQDHDNDDETISWADRLKDHKIRFDPDVLGPFDIAVVLTGSNDLKSAFFPFLLSGEDAEFRRQAQQRGGGYGSELTRLLQVLDSQMRIKLQTLRHQVEVAKDRVLESVDNLRERLHSHDASSEIREDPGFSDVTAGTPEVLVDDDGVDYFSTVENIPCNHKESYQKDSGYPNLSTSSGLDDNANRHLRSHCALNSSLFPMVVLPGLPARALPIFTVPPLRWLAVPIVDIMDTHKDKLSKQHNGEVLFVDAPPADIIAEYACERGMYREEERQDQLLLKLTDIKKRRALQIESDMCQYFDKKSHPQVPEQLPNGQKHFAVWSEDGIHPNDDGYAFWGRYIGHAIVEEWKRKRDEIGIAIV